MNKLKHGTYAIGQVGSTARQLAETEDALRGLGLLPYLIGGGLNGYRLDLYQGEQLAAQNVDLGALAPIRKAMHSLEYIFDLTSKEPTDLLEARRILLQIRNSARGALEQKGTK